jgi:hypothetical protein
MDDAKEVDAKDFMEIRGVGPATFEAYSRVEGEK